MHGNDCTEEVCPYTSDVEPRWRNGRRARFRSVWEQSRGGSSPLLGTNL